MLTIVCSLPALYEVRAELTARIETLNRGRSNSEAWMKALKHEMATERVKREIAEERLWTRTEEWKVRYFYEQAVVDRASSALRFKLHFLVSE